MKVPVLVQWIRFELIGFRLDQLFETRIVSDGDEGLYVELKAQRRSKADICTGGEVKRAACQAHRRRSAF